MKQKISEEAFISSFMNILYIILSVYLYVLCELQITERTKK